MLNIPLQNPFCGIFYVKKNGIIYKTNKLAGSILGYSCEEIKNKSLSEIFHTKALKIANPTHSSILNLPSQVSTEFLAKHKNGRSLVLSIYKSTHLKIEDFEGYVLYVDTSDFQKMSSDNRNYSTLSLAIKSANAGLLYYDFCSNKLFWDGLSKAIFEVDDNSFNGDLETWERLLDPNLKDTILEAFKAGLVENDIIDLVYPIITPKGNKKYIWAVSYVIRNIDNEPIALSGLHFDVTEKKLYEQRLIESNKELSHFAAIVAHDIKSPLASILGLVQNLKSSLPKKTVEDNIEYFNFIEETGKNMSGIISGLLNHAKIGNRNNFEILNTKALVAQVLGDLNYQINVNNAEITVEDLPHIKGTSLDIRLLFQNLISNAIRFKHSDRAPEIKIGLIDEKDKYQFYVSDNGIGIADEQLGSIFEMFNKHGAHPESSGIGLATCKKIVSLHGGEIWATSDLQKGSTLHFTIPKNIQ